MKNRKVKVKLTKISTWFNRKWNIGRKWVKEVDELAISYSPRDTKLENSGKIRWFEEGSQIKESEDYRD